MHLEAVGKVCEIVEIVIHQILYLRNVYPPDIFTKTQKFLHPIFTSRHPKLTAYVHTFANDLAAEIGKGRRIDRVLCLIVDERGAGTTGWEGKVLERWVFEFGGRLRRSDAPVNAVNPTELDAAIRALLLKVYAMDSMLRPPIGEGTSFALVIDEPEGPTNKIVWSPLKSHEVGEATGVDQGNDMSGNGQIVPGKLMEIGDMTFQFFVEENDFKGKGRDIR